MKYRANYRSTTWLSLLLLCGAAAAVAAPANASACLDKVLHKADRTTSTARAFDFYEGTWTVQMKQRNVDAALRPASAWTSFSASVSVRRIFQGAGFVEEYRLNKPRGTKYALGTRLYDPKTNQWAIYWANKDAGEWEPPARGGSLTKDGIEIIYDDTWGGRAILTRYKWTTVNRDQPVWEQSLSGDCGVTWIPNWTMSFARITTH